VINENVLKNRGLEVLFVRRLPGRLNSDQSAALIGCQPHDIPVLIRSSLLKPLAGGARNCVKFFGAATVLELIAEPRWLDKVTRALSRGRKVISEMPNSTVQPEVAKETKRGLQKLP